MYYKELASDMDKLCTSIAKVM